MSAEKCNIRSIFCYHISTLSGFGIDVGEIFRNVEVDIDRIVRLMDFQIKLQLW